MHNTIIFSEEKRPFILILIICFILLILLNPVHFFSFWIFLILKTFIHGVSSFKINLFLVYTSVLCLLLLIGKNSRISEKTALLAKLNFASIILASLAGLWSFISITQKLKLPFSGYAEFFKDHYHTTNYFSHTHSTKILMFYLVKLLNNTRLLEQLDVSFPLAEYVNPYATGILALFVLSTSVLFIMLSKEFITKWDKPYRVKVFILYTLASYNVIKSLIDGGPFSYDLWPSVITIHILYCAHSAESLLATVKRHGWWYCLAILSLCGFNTYVALGKSIELQTVIGSTFFICIYTLIILAIVVKYLNTLKVILTAILCCIGCSFYLNMYLVNDLRAFTQKIKEKDKVLYYNYPSSNTDMANFSITDYSKKMLGKRFVDVYRELGENPFRNRHVAILKNDAPPNNYIYIFQLKALKSKNIFTLPSSEYLKIRNAVFLPQISKRDFVVHLSFNPKFFPYFLHIDSTIDLNNEYAVLFYLNHYLISCGITEYVILF